MNMFNKSFFKRAAPGGPARFAGAAGLFVQNNALLAGLQKQEAV